MRILITGINGFVGKALYANLSDKYEVFGIYNSGNALFDNCTKCDLVNYEQTKIVFDKLNSIDVIIHLAAETANASNINDLSVVNSNSAMAKNLAVCAMNASVKKIINLSSSSVYPNIDGVYDENSIPNPSLNTDCIYGLSKLNAEFLLNYFLAKSSIDLLHLRTTMIYGNGMNGSRIIPVIEKEIIDSNTVTLYGNGERLLNLIHVNKLVDYISRFIDIPIKGVINIGDECISVLNLAQRIIEEKGNSQTKIILKEEGNKTQFVLDIKKLKEIFNKVPIQ